jgi:glycosyltransferase involved in cell wall biosynthesis
MLGAPETVAFLVRTLVGEFRRRLDLEPALGLELLGKPEQRDLLERLFPPHPRLSFTAIPGRRFWTSIHLPFWFWRNRRALRERLAVVLFPGQNVPAYVPLPTLALVLDTAFLDYPDCFERNDRLRLRYLTRSAVRRASRILAISHVTAKDVVRHYGVDPSRVAVVPLAADTDAFKRPEEGVVQQILQTHDLEPGYVLAVGTLQPRKNYERLIEAMDLLRKRGLTLKLVIVGTNGWLYKGIFDAAARTGAEDSVRFLGYVPEEHLPALYAGARLSVQVGLHEGFGLPVLEAFACGTPMVVSSTGAVAEVAGSAALTVDPTSTAAIAAGVETLATDASLRAHYRSVMPERLAEYSWARTAEATLAAARDVARVGEVHCA